MSAYINLDDKQSADLQDIIKFVIFVICSDVETALFFMSQIASMVESHPEGKSPDANDYKDGADLLCEMIMDYMTRRADREEADGRRQN